MDPVQANSQAPAAPVPPTSAQIASDTSLVPVWDPGVEFPSPLSMPDLDIVTHVKIESAVKGGYHDLHESSIAWHKGVLYCCWANHPIAETNFMDELIRGSVSGDGGLTWSPATTWVAAHTGGSESFNHPVIYSRDGKLWGFFTRWADKYPSMEIFTLNEATGAWESTGVVVKGFVPFQAPMQTDGGGWIIGGEHHWHEAAVLVGKALDFSDAKMVEIPRPQSVSLLYPEAAIFHDGESLVACCRPCKNDRSSPTSRSYDAGLTWTPLAFSNFPLGTSQPCAGRLSTGQNFLITNNAEEGRALLSIAVTEPGGKLFKRVWKIRHQSSPRARLLGSFDGHTPKEYGFVGRSTQWSYPSAVEHEGKLYISYTHGKEDCVLSIIPVSVLKVGFEIRQ